MRTNENGPQSPGQNAPQRGQTSENPNRQKMSKIDTFQFEAVDSKIVDDIQREEEARLNAKTPPAGAKQAGDYQFFTTNSVRRMDTQTVHRMMTTTSLEIPASPGGKRKAMTKKRMAALLVPLCIIVAYILCMVCLDILGLLGFHYRMTPLGIVLYILYLLLTLAGVMLLMFMDMMPKPLALLVIFMSLFCVHGNPFFMVPLIVAFVAVGITVEGAYPRIAVCGIALFMAFYACVLGVNRAKIIRSDEVVSEDGAYVLVLQTEDNGKELSYTLLLETTGSLYKQYEVEKGYVDIFYFGEGKTVAYGQSNEYGQPKTVKTAKIEDLIK